MILASAILSQYTRLTDDERQTDRLHLMPIAELAMQLQLFAENWWDSDILYVAAAADDDDDDCDDGDCSVSTMADTCYSELVSSESRWLHWNVATSLQSVITCSTHNWLTWSTDLSKTLWTQLTNTLSVVLRLCLLTVVTLVSSSLLIMHYVMAVWTAGDRCDSRLVVSAASGRAKAVTLCVC